MKKILLAAAFLFLAEPFLTAGTVGGFDARAVIGSMYSPPSDPREQQRKKQEKSRTKEKLTTLRKLIEANSQRRLTLKEIKRAQEIIADLEKIINSMPAD